MPIKLYTAKVWFEPNVWQVVKLSFRDLPQIHQRGSLKIELHEEQIGLQFRVAFAFRVAFDLAETQVAIQSLCGGVIDACIQENARCAQVSRVGQDTLHELSPKTQPTGRRFDIQSFDFARVRSHHF